VRLLLGLEHPDDGDITVGGSPTGGRSRSELREIRRHLQLVYQNPFTSLDPTWRVGRIVREPLDQFRVGDKADRAGRVQEALSAVGLDESFLARRPAQLSGGQRQRVALARAIVNRPQVLLLDEPLGALDLKLRQEMQVELKRIQQEVGITFVYVTHDQEEALTMSDRLAVFNHGRIEQVGAPAEVYERPDSEFIAGFVGVSNMLERGGRRFTIRPEKVRLLEGPHDGLHTEAGVVRDVAYVGMVTRYLVELREGGELQVVHQNLETTSSQALEQQGREVTVGWSEEHTYAIPDEEGT